MQDTEKEPNDDMSDSVQRKVAEDLRAKQQQRDQIERILEERMGRNVFSVVNNPALNSRVVATFSGKTIWDPADMRLLTHLGMATFKADFQRADSGVYTATFSSPDSGPPYDWWGKKVVFFMEQRPTGYGKPGHQFVAVIEDDGTEDGGPLLTLIPEKHIADELAQLFEWEVTDDR